MGGLATHSAWDSILKLEEWFGNHNLEAIVRRDGSAVVMVEPIEATFKFHPDGTGIVEHRFRNGKLGQLVVGHMDSPASLPCVMGSIAGQQPDPSPFAGEVREEINRVTGVLPLVVPIAHIAMNVSCELLSFIGTTALRVTVNMRDDGTHGGKIQRGRWPDAMTIHFPTMSREVVRDALEVMNV